MSKHNRTSLRSDSSILHSRLSASRSVRRSSVAVALAGVLGMVGAPAAVSQQICKPALAITDVQFSGWQLPTMERKWTAKVAVDASKCAANSSGHFEVGFLRLIENGVDVEFKEEFAWMSPSVRVGLVFWANEAVGRYWINKVSDCPCAEETTTSVAR
jgi:hypothetical protein